MEKVNLLKNTPGTQTENTAQNSKSDSLANSIASNSSQVQKSRRKRKRVSGEKCQALAYKKQREKANARNRKYLEKMTDAQREERNRKRREAYQKNKNLNLIKDINDLAPRQQQKKRKYWREASAKYRKQKQQLKDVITSKSQTNSEPCVVSGDVQLTPLSSQRKHGEKAWAKNNTQLLREIQEKDRTIVELQHELKMLQKSLQRKKKNSLSTRNLTTSPNRKVKTLTRGCTVPKTVRK
ncbi:unnamed protein product [Larinioides sclopetarius]|uniref:Uncharacterized protein n=1 Tax=Larinioides sclopetarius TaxID=280406 RepID=A0AAV2BGI3_9ARAC